MSADLDELAGLLRRWTMCDDRTPTVHPPRSRRAAQAVLSSDVVERIKRDAYAAGRRSALEDVTQAWQFKGWADTFLRAAAPLGPIPCGQAVTEWLRSRVVAEPPETLL